jgi:DNA-binding NtrC family response regulator
MSRGSLLLVDDDRHVLESMTDWLRHQGFDVDAASGYRAALGQLDTGYATVETGVEALRAGAFDLLTKPLIDEELEWPSTARSRSGR